MRAKGRKHTMLKTNYSSLDKDETYEKFAKDVFANTFLLNKEKWDAFISKPDTAALHKDPAYKTATDFLDNFNNNYGKYFTEFTGTTYALNKKYLKGVLEMKKGQAIYPDANQTMRVSYGNVKSYSPKDGVNYNYVCTLKGVMEKYIKQPMILLLLLLLPMTLQVETLAHRL